jgi:type IV secretory pathway VirJ component
VPAPRIPAGVIVGLLAAGAASSGCATLGTLPASVHAIPTRESSATVQLHGRPLSLHLAKPAAEAAKKPVLVLYASGDGGWFGTAVGMFRTIAAAGFPTVGLSSRAFLKLERPGHAALSPKQVALDYDEVLGRAREALELPSDTPAVLTGWSRGASLAVLAAAATETPADAAGIVAIGLTEGEDLRIDGPADESDEGVRDPHGRWPFAPYQTLAHAVAVPAAVIQSTGDAYLPADDARTLFGADSATRRFYAVTARSHAFKGGEPAFVAALGDALHWVHDAQVAEGTDTVTIRGHALAVRTYGVRGAPPIVVSSGDGGWIHLGPHVAEVLAAHGYFVVGFDTRAYLSSFTSGRDTLRPEDEPGDYRVLAAFAARGCSRKPVLVGVSEGAGLSLMAATDPATRNAIAGVIGLGLPDVNELGWHWKDALIYLTHATPNEPTFSAAALAPRAAPAPLALIQSTHDEFVPIPEAQRLFAAAREPKKLWIVNAADHRFSDNLGELDQRLTEALAWISASADHPEPAPAAR